MNLGAEAVVVLHIGAGKGDPARGAEDFIREVATLSEPARRRLVIENDDRTYALRDVLAVSERTGLRVVWDILHHHCHDPAGIPDREALSMALATWPAPQVAKIHYSTPKTAVEIRKIRKGRRVEHRHLMPELRAHADVVDPIAFETFLRETAADLVFDVMLEAKAKDLALLRLREQLAKRGIPTRDGELIVDPAA